MKVRIVWRLDQVNHVLLGKFYLRRLCDLNERLIWSRGMQGLRMSNAAGPHKSATEYDRKAKHRDRMFED